MDSHPSPPTVLIVGAGIGGLLLGALLERINFPYHIYERATELRALGSALAIGANILPVFEQLGLLEEIEKFCMPCYSIPVSNADLSKVGAMELVGRECTGYHNYILSRPRLYELLIRQIPAHKISLRKKIVSIEEVESKVTIRCSDNSSFEGDILIGADGAYSGVRKSLFKSLDEKGLLPQEDLENFEAGFVCMVGVATPKNPEKYPQLKDDFCHFSTVLGGGNKAWNVSNVPDNQLCWALSIQFTSEETKDKRFKNSEWGPESNEEMMKDFQDFPSPFGGKMKDIFDDTPKELISKVYLEEKVFETWCYGRTVLIGDACHKMLPSAGQGATNAMQDAVVLANCLYSLDDYSPESLEKAFKEYFRQRYHRAKKIVEVSRVMSKIVAGQSWVERIIRQVVFNYLPKWAVQSEFAKNLAYRPQISWLPLAENRGTLPVLPQEGGKRTFQRRFTYQSHSGIQMIK